MSLLNNLSPIYKFWLSHFTFHACLVNEDQQNSRLPRKKYHGLPLSFFNVSISKLSKVVLLFFHLVVANSLYSLQQQPSCHDVESSALLQFKESFVIKASASGYFGSYPKVSSWKLVEGETFNCCSWDGVDCDEETGHVIGLDLSSSCLYGSISSNSSLFSLVHLQRLNLADNDFNYSLIPTKIRNLPKLTYLNLSVSAFSGQVPTEVSQLSKLSSLDLSLNIDSFSGENLLKLEASTMKSLVRNFTSLEELDLSWVDISSGVANYMANLSLLTSLNLENCGMFGEFPARVFRLQNLKILSMRFNQGITGYLPEFNRSSPLMVLELAGTSFSGILPSSFEKLESLNKLDVRRCNFSGMVPLSLGNLRQLRYLDLSLNKFNGPIPASLSNLTQLTYLQLSDNNFSGYIPSSLCNLTELTEIHLSYNGLSGPIPSWLANLSRLESIDLGVNKLSSSIPKSFFTLKHLKLLYLDSNDLRGSVEILKLQNFTRLQLSGPKLEILLTESRIVNATVPNFTLLGLSSCNIKEFPNFLRYQQNLDWLDLSRNKLHGQVPKWFLNTSIETLGFLDLSVNFLSGFDHQNSVLLPWLNLKVLRLHSNILHGPLPIPRPNIIYYGISDNKLDGEISPLICNLSSLQYLDLLNNKLSGMLPQCLGTFSDDLRVLSLGNNSFRGFLPQAYSNTSNLRMIDVSDNKLQGQLPRSLENCVMLEFLVLSNNEFNDVFPFWLGTLPNLKLLAMPHNGFYGVIGKPKKNLHFPELRILDLSYNNFRGEFPSEYIFSGNAMRGVSLNQSKYMNTYTYIQLGGGPGQNFIYDFKTTITNKGVRRYYPKIQEDFTSVDLSSNKFKGNISEFIGNLKGLRSLNVSNNNLSGCIPSSLGNLTLLDSLDLSQNKLSGEIPQQLTHLTFLATLNISHNNLTGPIPQGTQLTSFNITSYEGNPGLCGDPLPEKCGNPEGPQLPPSSVEEDDSSFGIEFEWKFFLSGFGSGLVIGVVLADLLITRRTDWFIKIVATVRPMIRTK